DQRHGRHRDLRPRAAAGLALLLQLLEAAREQAHALPDQPPVAFELRFTRAAQADAAAALALEVGPAAHEARGDVLQLGEFDLQLALVAACAQREDVEDQAIAVEHAPP